MQSTWPMKTMTRSLEWMSNNLMSSISTCSTSRFRYIFPAVLNIINKLRIRNKHRSALRNSWKLVESFVGAPRRLSFENWIGNWHLCLSKRCVSSQWKSSAFFVQQSAPNVCSRKG
jgi:hypothetical protein